MQKHEVYVNESCDCSGIKTIDKYQRRRCLPVLKDNQGIEQLFALGCSEGIEGNLAALSCHYYCQSHIQ